MRTASGYRYGPNAAPRHQRPVWRIERVMRRLSRDRWLLPRELMRIGLSLAGRCSAAPMKTLEAAVPPVLLYGVGMLNGSAAYFPDQPGYGRVVELANSPHRFRKGAAREIELLNIILKNEAV